MASLDPRILTLFLIGLTISIMAANSTIPNRRNYWPADFQFEGKVDNGAGVSKAAPFTFDGYSTESQAAFTFSPYVLPFMSPQMKSVTHSFLSIMGSYPSSDTGSFVPAWDGNSSGIGNYPRAFGWNVGDGAGTLSTKNGTIIATPAESTGYLSFYNFQDQRYSSNVEGLILVNMSRVQNAEWYLNIIANGQWNGLTDLSGTKFHTGPGLFVYRLGPGLQYGNPSITASSIQSKSSAYVELERIEFGEAQGSGNISFRVNGNNVGGLSALPAAIDSSRANVDIETDVQFPLAFLSDGIDTMTMHVQGGISWTVDSIILHLFVDVSQERPQAWTELPYPIIIYATATVLLVVASIRLLDRLAGWLRKNDFAGEHGLQTNGRPK